MTVELTVTLRCDKCDASFEAEAYPCPSYDEVSDAVAEAREVARAHGWSRPEFGLVDRCPAHGWSRPEFGLVDRCPVHREQASP